MKRPAVSVIVATHNYGRYLSDTLCSVVRQTWADWELLIVDDGSNDDTPEVVRPFLEDPRVRYVRSDNLGQPRAKNLGIELSRGELIAFLDGDDLWLPIKLERQVRLMNAEPDLGVTFTRRFLIGPDGDLQPSTHPPFPRGMVFNDILVNNFVCFSSCMVRRSVFEHVGAFDPRLDLAIDYDLWLRVAKHYPVDYVDEPLVKYRTGHGNLSKRIVERITTVLSTMRRCLVRRGNLAGTPREVLGEAWGSTYRTMGYVLDRQKEVAAARWYANAARYDGAWKRSVKAIGGVLFRQAKRRYFSLTMSKDTEKKPTS